MDGHVRRSENRATPPKTHDRTWGAADPVCQPPTNGPHERGEHDESGGAESRVRRREAELRAQQRRQVNRERDKAPKGQEIEGVEHRKFVASATARNPVDPFIDPEGYRAFIDAAEAELRSGRTH